MKNSQPGDSFDSLQAFDYHQRVLRKPLGRMMVYRGLPLRYMDEALAELDLRLLAELQAKSPVNAGRIWLFASRKAKDIVAEHLRRRRPDAGALSLEGDDDSAGAIDVCDDSQAAERDRQELYEAVLVVIERLLDPGHRHYAGEPDKWAYDRALVDLWMERPDAKLRHLGRELKARFEESHPDSEMAEHDETYACKRMADFMARLHDEL